MESIPEGSIFEFHPDTLPYLRKQYDLDKPGRIEEAIQILEEWIKKQNHFLVKEFSKDYLERSIIISKGSVERAKTKLDKICTFRTILPHLFEEFDVRNSKTLEETYGSFLPKLTKDHYRVYFFKSEAKIMKTGLLDCYRYFFMQCEYIQAHDYCNGVVVLADFTETNLIEMLKWFNAVDVRDVLMVLKEGYGMRIKGLHLVSGSKAIDAIVAILKQVMNPKLAGRVFVHKTIDDIKNCVEKDILPVEYGGKEKPLFEINKKFVDSLTSDNFTAHLKQMRHACTNEKLRLSTKEADQYLGISGSFRTLSVD